MLSDDSGMHPDEAFGSQITNEYRLNRLTRRQAPEFGVPRTCIEFSRQPNQNRRRTSSKTVKYPLEDLNL